MTNNQDDVPAGPNVGAESKRDRFVRVAERRVNKVVTALRILGYCGNKTTYEYASEDVDRIFSYLEDQLKVTKGCFRASAPAVFKLDVPSRGD